LDKIGLAYLHLFHFGASRLPAALSNPLILLRAERTLETLSADIEAGRADVVAIGKWALADPDFATRLKAGAPLNQPDPNTFYGRSAAGYTDDPPLGAAQAA
jgi:N-ethylmaleimide reductase